MKLKNILILASVLVLLAMAPASAEIVECVNCSDCTSKIQNASAGDTVQLTTNLSWCNGHCIDFGGADSITFDGGGYMISGDDVFEGWGIYLPAYSQHNTIKNVSITDFRAGVYMFTSSYNIVQNITSNSNYGAGVTLLYGTGNLLIDCVLQENSYYDFNFVPDILADCDNCLVNVTGSGDRPIGFYNETAHLAGTTFSALYLCAAHNSTLDNISIVGSSTIDNNGLRIYYTDGAQLSNIMSSNNFEGVSMDDSTNVYITDSTFNDNHHYNVFLRYSTNNVFNHVQTCGSSQAGIYLYHSPNNVMTDIMAIANPIGIKFDQSDANVLNNSHIIDNWATGLSGLSAADNVIYNNYFDNGNNVDTTSGLSNVWNVTNRTGPNIYGGAFIGGNYWEDYTGWHTSPDGFGGEPYVIDVDNIDYLPLVIESDYECGDVNCDGGITISDVVETYYRVIDPEYPLASEWAADVNGSGTITISDVVEIYYRVIDPEYPLNCEC